MIKRCARCGKEFDALTNAKYCPTCRPEAYRERNRKKCRQWYLKNREHLLEYYRQRYIKSKLAVLRGVSK